MHLSLYQEPFPFSRTTRPYAYVRTPPTSDRPDSRPRRTPTQQRSNLRLSLTSYAFRPSSFMRPRNFGPSCNQPIEEIDEDFDLDYSLLRPTGHEIPSNFPISVPRSDPLSDLNHQVSPSTSLAIQPPLLLLLTFLRAASPHHPLLPRFRSRQPLYHHLLCPLLSLSSRPPLY